MRCAFVEGEHQGTRVVGAIDAHTHSDVALDDLAPRMIEPIAVALIPGEKASSRQRTLRRSPSSPPAARYGAGDIGQKKDRAREGTPGLVVADAANAAIRSRRERGDQFLTVCFSMS